MIADSLKMPVLGRSAAAVTALAAAVPLCHVLGITDERRVARRIGFTLSSIDALGVMYLVIAPSLKHQRRAAILNAIYDLGLATGLVTFGLRRQDRQRTINIVAAASVFIGAGAWATGTARVYQVSDSTMSDAGSRHRLVNLSEARP